MEGVAEVLQKTLLANQAQGIRPTDYLDPDGLLVCGVCGEPREFFVPAPINAKVFVRCRCDRERAEQEDAIVRAQFEQRRKSICFRDMPGMANCTFDADDSPDRKESILCRRYAKNITKIGNMGLLLYGGVGTGKSFLAAAICNECLSSRLRARMTSVSALVREIQAEPFSARGEALKALDEDLVVLDDFGAERNTDYMLEQVYGIIEARIESKKPMIVTTNLMPKDFHSDDIREQRVFDRILSVCRPVPVIGESRRAAKRANAWEEMDKILANEDLENE